MDTQMNLTKFQFIKRNPSFFQYTHGRYVLMAQLWLPRVRGFAGRLAHEIENSVT